MTTFSTLLTNGESSDIMTKYATAPDTANISGNVTNIQNGQHGPAMTIGVPSIRSHNTNMFPSRLAQQHQNRWKSLTGPFSATSRSHRVDTANLAKQMNLRNKKETNETTTKEKNPHLWQRLSSVVLNKPNRMNSLLFPPPPPWIWCIRPILTVFRIIVVLLRLLRLRSSLGVVCFAAFTSHCFSLFACCLQILLSLRCTVWLEEWRSSEN